MNLENKKILLNSIRNERRKKMWCKDEIEIYITSPDTRMLYEKIELLEFLNAAMNYLEDMELEIIESLFYEEKSIDLVAKQLKISSSTVRRKKEKILLKLRNIMSNLGVDFYV